MRSKRSLNKVLIGVVLGSAVLGIGGVLANLANKKKAFNVIKYLKKGNNKTIEFLKNLFKKNKENEKK